MPPGDSSVQIIGYAEPWIVSPGDSVDIKVGFPFEVKTPQTGLTYIDFFN